MSSNVKHENEPKEHKHDSVNEEPAVYSAAPRKLEDELKRIDLVIDEAWDRIEPALRYLADR